MLMGSGAKIKLKPDLTNRSSSLLMNKATESDLSGLKSRFEREEQAMIDINKYNSLA